MTHVQAIPIAPQTVARYLPLVGDDQIREVEQAAGVARSRTAGCSGTSAQQRAAAASPRCCRTLIAYARGAGIDARWLVIEGTPEFFRLTKRLHHALHGSSGDGSPLGEAERDLYEQVLRANAKELEGFIRPRDVVVLHDPQTAGLAPHLLRIGAVVIWRCHIGCDQPNEQSELGWGFLRPYLDGRPRAGVLPRGVHAVLV